MANKDIAMMIGEGKPALEMGNNERSERNTNTSVITLNKNHPVCK
jgi:hypothetical protein